MKPTLDCCDPFLAPYGSGYHWTHSRTCSLPSMRNQKVRDVTPRTHLVESRLTHPAGSALTETWQDHDPSCDCEPVCRYVNAWMDRDDDTAFEGAWR